MKKLMNKGASGSECQDAVKMYLTDASSAIEVAGLIKPKTRATRAKNTPPCPQWKSVFDLTGDKTGLPS